jgi:hypothetical protein
MLGMSLDEFWSLTPAMFDHLQYMYFKRLEIEERPIAHQTAFFHTLWINQGKKEGEAVEVIDTGQHMVHVAHKHFPGWVKTANGWVRESELIEADARVKQAAQKAIEAREIDPNG